MSAGELTFAVDPPVFERVPAYSRVVVVAAVGGDRAPAGSSGEAVAAAAAAWRREAGDPSAVAEVPEIKAWRAAFRAVGLNPTRTRPALEALARRAVRGDDLVFGDPFVDAGTATSLATRSPVGVHVVNGLDGELVLGPARGDETFTPFSGVPESPEPGEIVYRHGRSVLTRGWVWKQGALGSVSATSRTFAVNVDLLAGDGHDAVAMLTRLLEAAGAPVISAGCLTPALPSWSVAPRS